MSYVAQHPVYSSPIPPPLPLSRIFQPPRIVAPPPPLFALQHLSGGGGAELLARLGLRDVPGQIAVMEEDTTMFTARATYGEEPAADPRFSLAAVQGANFPTGAYIDQGSGQFHFTAITPGYYAFEVRVQDGANTAATVVHVHVTEATAP